MQTILFNTSLYLFLDLFRAAVGCSGSAFCTWAYQRNAVDAAYGVAAEIDPSFTRNRSSEELLEFLQSVDAVEIVNTNITYNVSLYKI